jgi:hypothetical protein
VCVCVKACKLCVIVCVCEVYRVKNCIKWRLRANTLVKMQAAYKS